MIKKLEELFPEEQPRDLNTAELMDYLVREHGEITTFGGGISMSSGCVDCMDGGGCTSQGLANEYGPKYEKA